jgi:hypothetical protein
LPGANGLTGGAVRDPRIGFVSGELAALLVSHFSRDGGAGFGVAFFPFCEFAVLFALFLRIRTTIRNFYIELCA